VVIPRPLRLAALALLAAPAGAAVSARLDLPDLAIAGADMDLRLVVEGATTQMKSFRVVEAPAGVHIHQGGSQAVNIVNGAITEAIGLTMHIDPQPAGATTIAVPAVQVTLADGSTVTAPAGTLPLGHGDARLVGRNADGNTVYDYGEITVDPPAIVPGQPATVTVTVYLRGARAIEPCEFRPPDDAIVLAAHAEWSMGRTFDAQGHTWDRLSASWQVTFPTPGTRHFDGQQTYQIGDLFNNARVPFSLHPATLDVTALPLAGRPDDFNGLIGPVAISAALDRTRIAAGEGAALTVTLSGRQVDLTPAPQPAFPPGLQAYPAVAPTVAKDANGLVQKTWHWDLVPAAPGDLVIPALAVGYFDPATAAYRQATTAPLTLSVLPGRNRALVVAGAPVPNPAATGAAPAAPAAVTAYAPLRGAAADPPSWLPWTALAVGALLGAIGGLALRLAGRGPAAGHRGRTLLAALAANDLDGAARALAALAPALTGSDATDAATLAAAIDRARFGGGTLDATAHTLARHLGTLR
jgi:hypothetical protein